jgi:hypothetical protein
MIWLSGLINQHAALQEQAKRLKAMENRAREAAALAYEDVRYPHLIEGEIVTPLAVGQSARAG